jgi:minor extracellular serine protease Vpr
MKISASILMTMALLTSCAPSGQKSSSTGLIASNYFSMRQQSPTQYLGMVQLQLPALLAVAQTVNGKAVINEELKAAIIAEQEEVIARLKALSPDVKIVATYKMVLNAIAFTAPSEVSAQIEAIEGVNRLLESSAFLRPQAVTTSDVVAKLNAAINEKNSVTFIGADKIHKKGITGKAMTVGVIDTGIDYTHSMLGGPGKKEIFEGINPDTDNEYFPNEKVVGGVDFVGTKYSAGGNTLEQTVPVRDNNPIDEGGHGSHVAGSVAGIGDAVLSYSGVAPEAKLYALKVFGKDGSTSDIAVIQALEYAADPTEKLDPNNRLDVVNLSLGGGFGKPKILYTEAVKNLTKAGTIVVASAGNSGDNPYITGAPATSDEAISVAASIDDMAQNIEFPAIALTINGEEKLLQAYPGSTTAPIEASNISGSLVYLGNGADAISDEVKAQAKGQIALMDRGVVNFDVKLKLAQELGATGVVMVNNADGNPISMGGEGKFPFPGVMITKADGAATKAALASGVAVSFNFSTGKVILRPDLIDTITDFSSRGPRTIDSLIKPEISGPGSNVISAEMGGGNQPVQMSGTSMSGPHLAGVMALMRQAFPTASVQELKARVLNNSKILMKGNTYLSVARQGAGRVQVEKAYDATVIAMPATLSLGEVAVASKKTIAKKVVLTNTSDKDVIFTTKTIQSKNIAVSVQGSLKVKAKSSQQLVISFTLTREDASLNNIEADGFVILTNADETQQINLPFLAVINKVSAIAAGKLVTHTVSEADKAGSEVTVTLTNNSESSGDALIFNLLAEKDEKKVINTDNHSSTNICDLESAGIRIIERSVNGQSKKMLQVGVKLYDKLTFWQPCDISLQIDSNNDGIADQELLGIQANYIAGIPTASMASVLLDAGTARSLRLAYELSTEVEKKENYVEAIQDANPMTFYNHSNVAVIETNLALITKGKNDKVGIKLAVTHLEADSKGDDFLASHGEKWQSLNLTEGSLAFYDMPETVTVKENDLEKVSMKRGLGKMRALILYPHNAPVGLQDKQSQILTEKLEK